MVGYGIWVSKIHWTISAVKYGIIYLMSDHLIPRVTLLIMPMYGRYFVVYEALASNLMIEATSMFLLCRIIFFVMNLHDRFGHIFQIIKNHYVDLIHKFCHLMIYHVQYETKVRSNLCKEISIDSNSKGNV